MMRPEIALITASQLPRPDLDTGLLVEELARLGALAIVISWDDDATDWGTFPLIVSRSPWDYTRRFDAFMEWAREVDGKTRLLNPFPLIRWNGHKGYLFDLAVKGVPVVPTTLIRTGDPDALARLSDVPDASEVVVKPAIGAGANDAMRALRGDPALASHLGALLRTKDALVQPFIPAVAEAGEVSLIYFEGRYSHAVRKLPALGDFRVQEHRGGTLHPHEPSALELTVASAALAAAPTAAAYGRVDLVEFEGSPVVMELELIEPELFLRRSPEGLQRFAQVLIAALGGRG